MATRFFLALSFLLLGLISVSLRAQAAQAPDELIKGLTVEVLDAIKKDPALAEGDVGKLNELVDAKILPHVNFEKMTRLAVGRGWRDASADQRKALTREFRHLLVRTYAGSLAQVKDQTVKMLPFRGSATDTDVAVRTQIVGRGEPVQLDYRLAKEEGGWKIYDVNVLGVWMVENYKSSFASEISKGGVDGLIKTLTERNMSLANKK